jgi:NAD(P)-dependent dehydrogenase (short-subunit alcohol dehydrogenase family)
MRALTDRHTMKAIVHDQYGSADTLQISDIEIPKINGDQVLVRVQAAGLDRGTWHIMMGQPYLMRLAGFGLRKPTDITLGSDVAGVIELVNNVGGVYDTRQTTTDGLEYTFAFNHLASFLFTDQSAVGHAQSERTVAHHQRLERSASQRQDRF